MHDHESWSPHTLQHCVDSEPLGYTIAVLAAGILFWYMIIAYIWWKSMRAASREAMVAWFALALIFVVCSMAGYVSLDIAIWHPKVAIVLRVVAMAIQNVLCPVFVWYAFRHNFLAYGRFQRIGQGLSGINFSEYSDAEISVMTKAFVNQITPECGPDPSRIVEAERAKVLPLREVRSRAHVYINEALARHAGG